MFPAAATLARVVSSILLCLALVSCASSEGRGRSWGYQFEGDLQLGAERFQETHIDWLVVQRRDTVVHGFAFRGTSWALILEFNDEFSRSGRPRGAWMFLRDLSGEEEKPSFRERVESFLDDPKPFLRDGWARGLKGEVTFTGVPRYPENLRVSLQAKSVGAKTPDLIVAGRIQRWRSGPRW
ncbi:MAG: hypothetical protein AAF517_12060 [Planctomycetota bacterium]